jgi:hypothetical protein
MTSSFGMCEYRQGDGGLASRFSYALADDYIFYSECSRRVIIEAWQWVLFFVRTCSVGALTL